MANLAITPFHTRPPRKAGYQPQLHIAAHGDAARLIMADVAPLLGARRRARVVALLRAGRGELREAAACYDVRRAA